jgi:hypothetical protein
MVANKNAFLWVLVEVRSGIPASIRAFTNRRLAETQEKRLRKTLNLENDETGIFPVEIEEESAIETYDHPSPN